MAAPPKLITFFLLQGSSYCIQSTEQLPSGYRGTAAVTPGLSPSLPGARAEGRGPGGWQGARRLHFPPLGRDPGNPRKAPGGRCCPQPPPRRSPGAQLQLPARLPLGSLDSRQRRGHSLPAFPERGPGPPPGMIHSSSPGASLECPPSSGRRGDRERAPSAGPPAGASPGWSGSGTWSPAERRDSRASHRGHPREYASARRDCRGPLCTSWARPRPKRTRAVPVPRAHCAPHSRAGRSSSAPRRRPQEPTINRVCKTNPGYNFGEGPGGAQRTPTLEGPPPQPSGFTSSPRLPALT
ncbi:translation initiation factor IF-2 [Dama dama]|uniref:translation initiation factor IF-2 n=1 Tax=Dama dama TaxID=30532 RepID=UPI002A35BADE|nr:translation initiation factor IF-2 [Dama dama]